MQADDVATWLEARATELRTQADDLLEAIIAKLEPDIPLDHIEMSELDVWRALHANAALLEDVAVRLKEGRWTPTSSPS